MYIKVIQVTFKSKNKVLEIQEYPAINNKVLNAKSRAKGIKFPTNKAHKVKNRINKNKALNTKKPIISKGIIKKYPLGFNPSGYSQGKNFKT